MLSNAVTITDVGEILVQATNPSTNATSNYQLTPVVPTRIAIPSKLTPTVYKHQIHLGASVIPNSGIIPSGQVDWYEDGKLVGLLFAR